MTSLPRRCHGSIFEHGPFIPVAGANRPIPAVSTTLDNAGVDLTASFLYKRWSILIRYCNISRILNLKTLNKAVLPIMFSSLIITSLLPMLSSAMEHTVKVGSGGLAFDPDTVQANQGDTIVFEFYPKSHSVAQAAFDKPCEPLSDDDAKPVFSGFFPIDGDDTMSSTSFSMRVNNTDPMWLYCSQSNHCQSGQVMVVNPV